MNKLHFLKIGLFILVFLGGGIMGVFVASYQYHKIVFSAYATGAQADLYGQILIVSHLLLGEVDQAVSMLDSDIDAKILSVSSPENAYNIQYRDKILSAAKAYRDLCPSYSVNADKITETLANYPAMNTFSSESSIGRLVQQAEAHE